MFVVYKIYTTFAAVTSHRCYPDIKQSPRKGLIYKRIRVAVTCFSPLFLCMKQTLYLDLRLAQQAVNDKMLIESLAFSMLVKLTFVSSRVQSATVQRCKDLFHIGSTRMCRIIRNGIAYGLLKRDGADLIALSLREEKSYHIRLNFECKTYSRTKALMDNNPESKGVVVCQYSLKAIIDLIRKSVLLNHISKQTDCEDTINRVNGHVKSINALRRAKKKCKCMLRSGKVYTGLSRKRIMDVTNVCKKKAKQLIDSLCDKGLVHRVEQSVRAFSNYKEFSSKAVNAFYRETGLAGYLYKSGSEIRLRISNKYVYSCDLITFKTKL